MKTKLHWLAAICLLFSSQSFFAQQIENKPQKAIYIGTPTKVEKIPSIASRANLQRPENKVEEMMDGRASKYDIVPGKGSTGADVLAKNPHRLKNTIPNKAPLLVFETGASGSQPTDPAGAVGPNHYISVINTAFQIFDKSGNSLTGGLVLPNPTIFPSGGCCDLTASYDNIADRWVLSFLGGGVQIAVSDGPDPINDGWTTYTYTVVNDYQKLSVWSDGYYMTENTGAGEKVHVFDRDAMLAGNPAAGIQSFVLPGLNTGGLFHSPQVLNISDDNSPAVGNATVIFHQDDAFSGISEDHIKVWDLDIDWATPGNSIVSAAVELGAADGVSAFTSVFDGGSFVNLAQPSGGPSIDALQGIIMNQAQYKKFPTYNSAIFNFVVDVDGTSAKQAGVRWYELRQTGDGQPWTLHQEGTYTAPDNRHAWNASMIMDAQGNIGMGYTGMSSPNSTNSEIRVGSYYTGRFANDAIGVMTLAEETIIAGDANIPGTRYGDYSKIDIDPDGGKKFWFVNEVMSGGRKNVAGVFQIAPNTTNDVGVVSVDTPMDATLTNAETVTVTVFNFGENLASGFDVTYQVDGGVTITEAFVGTLASQTSAQHTFGTTADLSTEGQTYAIMSCTDYTIDEDNGNDCVTVNVIHVAANDIGVIEITAPTSGEGLGSETVTVTIENFGTADQSGFNVNYIIDGGSPVVETVAKTVAAGNTISYSFTTLANLSSVGTYSFTSSSLLVGDADASNNTASRMVANVACSTVTNGANFVIGPDNGDVTESIIAVTENIIISDVNVTINLNHTFDGDLEIKLVAPDGSTEVMLSNRNGGGGDNYTNTVFDDDAGSSIASGSAPFAGSFTPDGDLNDLNGLSSVGDWKLIITDRAAGNGGALLDWTLQLCASTSLSVNDYLVDADAFEIIYKGNDQYLVKLSTTSINERLELTVKNVLGQTLLWKTLENETGQGYEYKLDMSYVSSGIYFVRIGNARAGNVKRIIVD
ncbi:MAG: subtilisin-like proprotein convertase family protein [Glaciecola sp.]|jgi:subtilisin-like proprotein convertase family protein